MTAELKKDDERVASKLNLDSLDALLNLYKDTFDLEENRKDTLENKASMILGFSGIIAGLITGLMSSPIASINNIATTAVFVASILCFTVGGIFALLTVKLKNYMQPFNTLTPEQIDELLLKEDYFIKNEIVKNYSDSLLNNQVLNNQKASKLNIAFFSATLGIILTLVAAILAVYLI
ncbi:MAG: hypothetical protein ACTSRS_16010 [Candidatus Helarchaeota archaeon]